MAISKYRGMGALALVALCVALLAACGSNSSSTKTAQSAGPGAATEAPSSVGTTAQTAGATASTNLPVYPGATRQPMPAGLHTATSHCGFKITVVSMYKVDAGAQTVADWYRGRLPGASVINASVAGSGGSGDAGETALQIFDASGGVGVIVTQMHFTSAKLANAAKSIGVDKTGIGFETYDPPMSRDYIALEQQATGSDASAKQAATEKLKSMCASNS